MPRKSLPSTSTPKSHSLPSHSQSTLKRSSIRSPPAPIRAKRRHQQFSPDPLALVDEHDLEQDPEKELEAWQDFAAEHYEMVEQLPLELHRNFRLLRELDDGCAAQTDKLHSLIRAYITQRLAPRKPPSKSTSNHASSSTAKGNGDVEMSEPGQQARPETAALTKDDYEPQGTVEEMGIPQPDGAGGLVLPPAPADEGSQDEEVKEVEGRREFPNPETVGESSRTEKPPDWTPRGSRQHDLLPEIGRLAREIVRNGEEKVAVAVGAYNSIDRHIRALDSALSAQEASILLGLRPATLPSSAVDDTMNLAEDGEVADENADGEVTIGLVGGGARKGRKGKKGRKGWKEEEAPKAENDTNGYPAPPFDIPADPNEPRYCYCNQVSYGQMIGCENDECPLEWFHLGCVGLANPPTGKWWCNVCRPKVGLGMGGAGAVQPKKMVAAGSRGRKK